MFKKLLAAALVVAVLATAVGVLPGLVENIAFACDRGDPGCTP